MLSTFKVKVKLTAQMAKYICHFVHPFMCGAISSKNVNAHALKGQNYNGRLIAISGCLYIFLVILKIPPDEFHGM